MKVASGVTDKASDPGRVVTGTRDGVATCGPLDRSYVHSSVDGNGIRS